MYASDSKQPLGVKKLSDLKRSVKELIIRVIERVSDDGPVIFRNEA